MNDVPFAEESSKSLLYLPDGVLGRPRACPPQFILLHRNRTREVPSASKKGL